MSDLGEVTMLLLFQECAMKVLICFGLCPLYINEVVTLIFSEMFQIYIH